jgi:hypothetical protein
MLSLVFCIADVVRPPMLMPASRRQTDSSRSERGVCIICFSRDIATHPLGLPCMSNCHPLHPRCPLSLCSDVMNDTCDKVSSVCIRHEILSDAFRVLCIGYACISMDSIVLFAKLCTVLLSNVSPPAHVSLILVSHVNFKPQPLFLPSLYHSSINFTPTYISDCPVSLRLQQFA